jgi:hypothetical protein
VSLGRGRKVRDRGNESLMRVLKGFPGAGHEWNLTTLPNKPVILPTKKQFSEC